MTAVAEQLGNNGPEGLIFLPGVQEGIAISRNMESDLSRIEFAILTGRGAFAAIRRDIRATEIVHRTFSSERARLLGDRAMASAPEM